jgi:predicted NBD/HSP70 family sugar kinase
MPGAARERTPRQVLDLAAAGDPTADRIVGNAARAFGVLVAAIANIALPEWILLTGEGIRLAEVGWDRLQDSIRENRNPEASKLDVHLLEDDPVLWARGAAAVAIQRSLLGELQALPEEKRDRVCATRRRSLCECP